MASITRDEIKDVLEALQQLPDFDRLPLPAEIHKAFNIPMSRYITGSFMQFYETYTGIRNGCGLKGETRAPLLDASGTPIIRPVLEMEPFKVEILTEMLEEPPDTSSPATGGDTTETRPCLDVSSLPAPDAV